MELNNIVIEHLTAEHGAECIKVWKELGVDVKMFYGWNCGHIPQKYYGVINSVFDAFAFKEAIESNAKIITLEELKAMKNEKPKRGDWVYVQNHEIENLRKAIFLTEIEGAQKPFVTVLESDEDVFLNGGLFGLNSYKHCEPIKTAEITLKDLLQLASEKLGVPVETIKIKE